MSEKFKLALIQMNSCDDFNINKVFIAESVKNAAAEGARLIVLPEHADAIARSSKDISVPVPGPVSDFYSELAAKYGIYLHCGSLTEQSPDGRPFNTSLIFNPSGNIAARYRKLHMFDVDVPDMPGMKESHSTSPGDSISVFRSHLCTMGLSICYDLRFPELYRIMALNGAGLLIVSANFTSKTGALHWEALLRARAIENGCYVAACDQCGTNAHFPSYGHSMVIDPYGRVIASLENESGILFAEFDPEKAENAKKQIPVLDNLRKDIYRPESDKIVIFNEVL